MIFIATHITTVFSALLEFIRRKMPETFTPLQNDLPDLADDLPESGDNLPKKHNILAGHLLICQKSILK
jgi:hypothetical protein